MGRVGDEALLRVEGTVKTFQQPVDRVGEIPQLVAGSAEGESLVDVPGGDPLDGGVHEPQPGHDVLQFKSKAGHAALVASREVCNPWAGTASHENSPDLRYVISENALIALSLARRRAADGQGADAYRLSANGPPWPLWSRSRRGQLICLCRRRLVRSVRTGPAV